MCLIIEEHVPLTAKEDITCYKVLRKNGRWAYKALYFPFEYKFNQTYRLRKSLQIAKTSFAPQYSSIHTNGASHFYKIMKGFHSYKNIGLKSLKCGSRFILAECTIPKGAKYFIGKHNNDEPGYVSTSIRINKQIFR